MPTTPTPTPTPTPTAPGTPYGAMNGSLRSLDNEVADMLKFLEMAGKAGETLRTEHGRLHSLINEGRNKANHDDAVFSSCVTDLSVALHSVKSFIDKVSVQEASATNYAWRYLAYHNMYYMMRGGDADGGRGEEERR